MPTSLNYTLNHYAQNYSATFPHPYLSGRRRCPDKRGSTVITENPHLLKLQLHVSEKDEYTLIEQSTFTIYFELYLIIINQYLNSYVHDIEHNRPGPSYGMYQNIDLCSNCI